MSASSNRAAGRARVALEVALALSLVACQPLPHPFEDDRPPAELLRVRDVAGVSIAPIEGKPTATATKLATAMAAALLKHDIPASDKTTGLGSYLLYGRVAQSRPHDGNASVTALWRLYDPSGKAVGEHSAKVEAQVQDWDFGNPEAIGKLAAASADGLMPLLEDKAPVEAKGPAEQSPRTRIAVRKISGAPGDGSTALANAVAAVLKRQDLAIAADGQKADLYVEGEVAVGPAKQGKQHVKIVWHVKRADGAEIGTAAQENDIPQGMLDGPWGDIAYSVALAAGDGLMQLVARGAAARKS